MPTPTHIIIDGKSMYAAVNVVNDGNALYPIHADNHCLLTGSGDYWANSNGRWSDRVTIIPIP